VVPAH
jgi:predicted TIM-barrel fold metal-dependent hydrolase